MSQLQRAQAAPAHPRLRYQRRRLQGVLLACLTPAILLLTWQFAVDAGVVRSTILPSPATIAQTLGELAITGELIRHLSVSLLRVIVGFALGALGGIVLGILTGLVRPASDALALVLGILRPIPVIAWVPLLILWLGIGESSKVTLIAIGTFWPVLLNLVHGIRTTDRKLLEVARVFEKDSLSLLRRVVLPAALPSLITGLRLGLGVAWTSVIAAELLGADRGIGYLIAYARELTQVDVMFTGLVAIGVTGILIDGALRLVERRLLRWHINLQEGR